MKENNSKGGRLRKLAFILAVVSFMPPIGILAGAVLAAWGANASKRGGSQLVALGAAGIAVSLFVSIHVTGQQNAFRLSHYQELASEQYDGLIFDITEAWLDSLVLDIEFYRLQHGSYPDSLAELVRDDGSPMTFELIDPRTIGFGKTARPFFYLRVGEDHYFLLSLGPDGRPFTEDDMVPDIEILPGSHAGLLKTPR